MDVSVEDEGKVLHALYDSIYRVGFSIAWPYTHASIQKSHARLNAAAPAAKPRDETNVLKFKVPEKRRFAVHDGGKTPGEAA